MTECSNGCCDGPAKSTSLPFYRVLRRASTCSMLRCSHFVTTNWQSLWMFMVQKTSEFSSHCINFLKIYMYLILNTSIITYDGTLYTYFIRFIHSAHYMLKKHTFFSPHHPWLNVTMDMCFNYFPARTRSARKTKNARSTPTHANSIKLWQMKYCYANPPFLV